MNYIYDSGNIILTECDSFSISETLECGQCFRSDKIGEEDYVIVAFDKVLRIKEENGNIIFLNTSFEDFENIWIDYFDLNREYSKIKYELSIDDEVLNKAVMFAPGIRILNQDFFECLISFIISQNNRIPMIKNVIKNISKKYGTYIDTVFGEEYYSFPTVEQLLIANEEELMLCKTGFRAKYIVDAVTRVAQGEIDSSLFDNMGTEDLRNVLMKIKGVGPKVSDCVLLFSCRRSEVFPTDVWIKRIMSHFYFDDNETSIKIIHKLAEDKYGKYAGFAQQYLFNYSRLLKIGTDKK